LVLILEPFGSYVDEQKILEDFVKDVKETTKVCYSVINPKPTYHALCYIGLPKGTDAKAFVSELVLQLGKKANWQDEEKDNKK
jgi:hypothetical protein